MYSPSSIIDPTSSNFTSHGTMEDVMISTCGMVSNFNSVDSLLIMNQYSPPHSYSLQQHQQQQKQQHLLKKQLTVQQANYRRVRPEPVK